MKQLGEYLVTTVGCHVYVYKLLPETLELEQVAFYYATFYISSVSVMKDYIMLCDAHKSVTFLSWKEDDFALIPLGKDYNDCFGLSTGFVSDGSQLGMLLGDDEGNVQLLQYAPKWVLLPLSLSLFLSFLLGVLVLVAYPPFLLPPSSLFTRVEHLAF